MNYKKIIFCIILMMLFFNAYTQNKTCKVVYLDQYNFDPVPNPGGDTCYMAWSSLYEYPDGKAIKWFEKNLENIEYLSIENPSSIIDTLPLEKLTNLVWLDLFGNDMDAIYFLPESFFKLNNPKVITIRGIDGMTESDAARIQEAYPNAEVIVNKIGQFEQPFTK